MAQWPNDEVACRAVQTALGAATPEAWRPPADYSLGACFVCFPRGLQGAGAAGDRAWAAAVSMAAGETEVALIEGQAAHAYRPGFLALRAGRLLEVAVRSLSRRPDALLVNASGRDHPRGAGLALHLGAVLGMPTIGVTHRPLLAEGPWPEDTVGAWMPLRRGGRVVGAWLRTGAGRRPLAVHMAWRTALETAVTVVRAEGERRTPEPLRLARQVAREARAAG